MKKYAIILPAIGLTMGSLHAQTVPLYLNYQGRVTGGTGTPLGATGTAPNFTAAPINRKVIFRIYDAQTGGNRLWSEQQTVVISLGEFSVLLGQGTASVYDSVTEARPALDSIFNTGAAVSPSGPQRFLEIVVDDGNGTFTAAADVPITPRQKINSTAYAIRAALADTVPDSAISANALAAGSVTAAKIADSSITSVKIADNSIITADLADNLITAAKIADGSVATAELANNAVTAAKLDATIGVWTVTGSNVYRPAGSVGIGKQPAVAFDVVGAIAATGNITTGGGIAATGAISGSSITTTGPFAASNITATGTVLARGGAPGVNGVNNNGFAFTGGGGLPDSGMFSSADGQVGLFTGGTERMRVTNIGSIGIGTTTPAVKLDVVGSVVFTMTDNGYQSNNWTQAPGSNPKRWVQNNTVDTVNGVGLDYLGTAGTFAWGFKEQSTAPVGIRSDSWMASGMGFMVYSDRRIKRDLHASETAGDLAAIRQLQVTEYRMVDPANGGAAWHKGFIAQEVEKVIPGAVTRSVEFVPDIFSAAAEVVCDPLAKTLTVTLTKDHGLKAGERVRLHMDGNRVDLNVSAVPSAREFVVEECGQAPKKVFVYGRQVNDFRTVDYDRIFTTSVGALQELKKEKDAEMKALQDENAGLRTRLAALEAADKTRDAKLAAIETLLLSAGKPAARTVSVKTGE